MSFNRPRYDNDAYTADLRQSLAPMHYQLYHGAHVNGTRCNPVLPKQHYSQVDVESDLSGRNRFHARTMEKLVHPDGYVSLTGAGHAISTFDPRAHVNVNPAVCPNVTKHLIFNSGIKRPTNPGYVVPDQKLSCSPRK